MHPVIASIQILIKAQNKSRSVVENLITGIYESLCDSLMKVVYNLLIRDNSTFEELTPQEKELWKKFKTDDNSRFFTSEPDTVPKFCSDWTSIPRLTFQVRFTSSPDQAPAVQPPQAPLLSPPTPPSLSSSSSLPNSSSTPSTLGTRPNLTTYFHPAN